MSTELNLEILHDAESVLSWSNESTSLDYYLILRIGQQKSQTDADVGLLETDAAVPEVDAGLPETDVGVPETLVGESETDADYLPSKLKITDTIYKTVDNNSRCDIL